MRSGRRSANRRGERGQALAEFALVLPLLLLLIAGIIEFGRAWNIKQAVTDAAREGARYTVVQDANVPTLADVQAKIEERLALASIETSTIVFSTNTPGCASAAACFRIEGKQMTVDVSTQYRMAFVGALMQWLSGSPDVTIGTQATMRNE